QPQGMYFRHQQDCGQDCGTGTAGTDNQPASAKRGQTLAFALDKPGLDLAAVEIVETLQVGLRLRDGAGHRSPHVRSGSSTEAVYGAKSECFVNAFLRGGPVSRRATLTAPQGF